MAFMAFAAASSPEGLSALATPMGAAYAALAAVALLVAVIWLARDRRLGAFPGPPALPLVGNLPAIAARDLTFFMYDVAQKYGKAAKVYVGARPWILLSDPALVRRVSYKCLARPLSAGSYSHVLVGEPHAVDSESAFWNRGDAWRASRRAFEAAFVNPTRLAAHMPTVNRCIGRFLRALAAEAEAGTAVDLKSRFGALAIAVSGECAYGVDFWGAEDVRGGSKGDSKGGGSAAAADAAAAAGAELHAASLACMECFELSNATAYLPLQLMLPGLTPLWRWLAEHVPDAAQRRHMAARQAVADVSRRLMNAWQQHQQQDKQQGGGGGGGGGAAAAASSSFVQVGGGVASSSFLAAMLEDRRTAAAAAGGAAGAGGGGEARRMDDVQVISQGLTFILASYDTTSTTLANTSFLVASNQHVQEKLRAELEGNRDALHDAARLGELPYLDAVLKESQRMYPGASYFWRDAASDIDLGEGRVIPSGSFVCCSVYNIHHDPAIWPEPERFLPERFLAETKGVLGPAGDVALAEAWLAFGSGPRACPGSKLATLVVKATLAALVLSYRIAVHPRQPLPYRLKTGLTLAPADGVWVALEALRPQA